MSTMTFLPGMASHAVLSEWIDDHETLLASVLLSRVDGRPGLRGFFVSEDASGNYLLRLCEGADDSWMIWIDQRRTRSRFGRAYADALGNAWLSRMGAAGWRIDWSARAEPQGAVHALIPVAA
ncbi:MAG: hypothetical protein ACLGI7_08360 [Gammaproteobacteria bacterium]